MSDYLNYVIPLGFAYFLYCKGKSVNIPYGPIGPVTRPDSPATTPIGKPFTVPITTNLPHATPPLKPLTANSCVGLASTAFATYPDVNNPCPDITSGWKHGGANQSICNKLAGQGYIPVGNACQLPGNPNSLKFVMYWLRGQ